MKVACTHFQCAAWAFQYLRDEIQTTSTDMAHELMNYYINVMLVGIEKPTMYYMYFIYRMVYLYYRIFCENLYFILNTYK